jgi:hypothetical protein
MSTHTTSRRWVGRILAAGVIGAAGVGFAPATAAATTQGGPVHTAALPTQQVDPDTAASARRSWETRGRPDRMAIVREYRIDVVSQGRITRQIPHRGGAVTLTGIDRALPSDWLSITDTTAVLDAAIVLVRDTTLNIDAATGVHTLQLTGGARPQDAASIHTGGGHLVLTGLAISSLDPATGQPVPPTAAGRPMIVASTGGRLDSTDVTISDLGTPGTTDDDAGAAIEYHTGSTGSLVRTTVREATVGVELTRSHAVHLEDLTVTGSDSDGLILSGDRATTMNGIRAIGNGHNGVLVSGDTTTRPITAITTSSNHAYGIAVVQATGTHINGVSTSTDTEGGLRISQSADITVTDYHATGQRVGIYTHVGSTNITLDGIHTNGGHQGLVIEKSSSQIEVRNSTFTGAALTGAALTGHTITLNDIQVRGSRSGIRIERGAHDIHLTALTIKGGHDGVVTAPDTTAVVITNPDIDHVEADAIRTFSPDARITGAHITGGTTGIDLAAGATITDTTINAAEQGIHSRSPQRVYASHITVDALEVGVNNETTTPLLLTDSQVHALESVRGHITQHGANNLSLPPLNLLSAVGIPLILLAIILEELHALRQRRLGVGNRRRRPPLPTGTA